MVEIRKTRSAKRETQGTRMMNDMSVVMFKDWLEIVPDVFKKDSLWKMKAHQYALFLDYLAWNDATKLMQDRRTQKISDQLYDAIGSVAANLAEGYSRGTGKDRARFYEYSLGSARESLDWYYSGRIILGEELIKHRHLVLNEIIRLLLTMIPQQRGRTLREEPPSYNVTASIEEIPQPL